MTRDPTPPPTPPLGRNGAPPDDEDPDDALAAEWALGVLDQEERAAAARRIESEPGFAARVAAWETRLSGLAENVAPTPPPARVKAALDQALDQALDAEPAAAAAASSQDRPPLRRAAPRGGLWNSLWFWRLGALAGAATAAAMFLWRAPTDPGPPPLAAPSTVLASLAQEGSDVHVIVVYDAGDGHARMAHLSGPQPEGRDFELWLIAGDAPPMSLGVVGAEPLPVAPDSFVEGVTLAITVEPLGGSGGEGPSGPVVAQGLAMTL